MLTERRERDSERERHWVRLGGRGMDSSGFFWMEEAWVRVRLGTPRWEIRWVRLGSSRWKRNGFVFVWVRRGGRLAGFVWEGKALGSCSSRWKWHWVRL